MNCDEFREKIKSGSDNTDSLIEHKNSCKDCQEWIMTELNTAPNGINKEKWQNLMSKHLPIVEEKQENTNKESKVNNQEFNSNQNEEPKKEKSMLEYYFSGLKYGIVFGLSLVVGFSIVQNSQNNKNQEQNTSNIQSIASDSIKIIASDTYDNMNTNASETSLLK